MGSMNLGVAAMGTASMTVGPLASRTAVEAIEGIVTASTGLWISDCPVFIPYSGKTIQPLIRHTTVHQGRFITVLLIYIDRLCQSLTVDLRLA
ncbi:hypothetical protein DSCO28_08790 [Desulfosarcina ovata subsp. sediminis]|uniref:Uncharacterized protein n=1 Tax=Desulfosarcina ovata subsp. sediminis TaxID=885957 RepID=A0A5K7ZR05_9BACT|nr:hypothetical protein DSCO28_08790 [Desulfosarcina ovata subsp. sediminis]